VALQTTYPSWGWWIQNGATTLLENWDLLATRDISDNHTMFGEIGAWFYKGIAGIRPDPLEPGFRHIVVRPAFIAELSHFEAQYRSPQGVIISSWTRDDKGVNFSLTVPANARATLYLPVAGGEIARELSAGVFRVRVPWRDLSNFYFK
jgi:alpha-L-rhamnosidase